MMYCLFPIAHGVEIKPIKQDYAAPLIEGINKYLTEKERGFFIPLPYNYSVHTNEREMQMFNAVEAGLGNQELRRLKHTIGSDVSWSFILAKNSASCFYLDFTTALSNLINEAKLKYMNSKVVCCGHSQGSQLLYSFIFDSATPIEGFISLGSPISMNSGAWDDWGKLPPNIKFWDNFYNDMDFVSSRIQGVHPSKEIADFVWDYKVPLGWNPIYHIPFLKTQLIAGLMAHLVYWNSDFVHQKIAEKIKSIINS
jgi:hypothetical protein